MVEVVSRTGTYHPAWQRERGIPPRYLQQLAAERAQRNAYLETARQYDTTVQDAYDHMMTTGEAIPDVMRMDYVSHRAWVTGMRVPPPLPPTGSATQRAAALPQESPPGRSRTHLRPSLPKPRPAPEPNPPTQLAGVERGDGPETRPGELRCTYLLTSLDGGDGVTHHERCGAALGNGQCGTPGSRGPGVVFDPCALCGATYCPTHAHTESECPAARPAEIRCAHRLGLRVDDDGVVRHERCGAALGDLQYGAPGGYNPGVVFSPCGFCGESYCRTHDHTELECPRRSSEGRGRAVAPQEEDPRLTARAVRVQQGAEQPAAPIGVPTEEQGIRGPQEERSTPREGPEAQAPEDPAGAPGETMLALADGLASVGKLEGIPPPLGVRDFRTLLLQWGYDQVDEGQHDEQDIAHQCYFVAAREACVVAGLEEVWPAAVIRREILDRLRTEHWAEFFRQPTVWAH